uniref:Uncharacterized protein n=1 Tax=viral metagenome TaxID=1070528 RepID=A0A6C0IZ96_9ZZZZ
MKKQIPDCSIIPDQTKFVRYSQKGKKYGKEIYGLQLEDDYVHQFISFNTFAKKRTRIPKDYKKMPRNMKLVKEF